MPVKPFLVVVTLAISCGPILGPEPLTRNLWPSQPPGETKELAPEADQTKNNNRLIAGRRVIRLGNVSTPQIAVYRPAKDIDTRAAVVICPGGGHNILAYDLEGTEVAGWLNSLGVTAIVLKYRVPTRTPNAGRWLAAVQDAQRAMSIVRGRPVNGALIGNASAGSAFPLMARPPRSRAYSLNVSIKRWMV